jgi:ATP-dependent DNA helicase Rep
MSDLNPRQEEAIRHLDGPLLVLAGAGSGKTRVITQKIAWLIRKAEVPARHIAAVTFTNKAAREMRERVGGLLGRGEGRGLHISTFHTLGLEILRREAKRLGYKPGFSILDAQDSAGLLKELAKQEIDDIAPVQWQISGWKNELRTPEHCQSHAADDKELRAALLYEHYRRALKAYNAVDFDDLILLPAQLFQDDPEALAHWQNRLRYLLVDEYQDTNLAQYELVKRLVGVREAFTVVGDDDQSIYAWRGARPENLARLQEDFPRLKLIKLEQNYRSTGRILKAANQLIANNPHLFEKRLWSEFGPGDPLRVIRCKDETHEAERVVSEILHHKFTKGAQYGDYAILYRGNHQAKLFEAALRQHNIPYFLSGGTSFFSRTEIKDLMGYLRLLANPDDDTAFLRIVNTPRREIGPTTLEKLGNYANQRHVSLLTACDELGLEQHLSGAGLERVREFAHWIRDYQQRAGRDHPVETVRAMLSGLDYEGWIHQNASSDAVGKRRWGNVEELVQWLQRLHEGDLAKDNLADMVRHLSLQDVLERQEDDAGHAEQVHLMTLHSAKGLEFPHVFLVGMEEEILPHRTSIEEETIEEERRLAYVGITRARRTLTITFAARRRRYGEHVSCEPSRFLGELPEEDLVWEGRGEQRPPEERQERGKAHLAGLRAMLR